MTLSDRTREFLNNLGLWNVAIFSATYIGCYLPRIIVYLGNRWRGCESPPVIRHKQQHETLVSFIMAFSAGVCLAVSFLFQIDGFRLLIGAAPIMTPDTTAKSCFTAGMVLAGTFLAFFLMEQFAVVTQRWHEARCGGISPCAVTVASQPLEAASVIRTITEHTGVTMEDLRCSSVGAEGGRRDSSLEELHAYSVPLIEESSPRCPLCHRRENAALRKNDKSSRLVLTFLLSLFIIHSFAEGLGLGVSACPSNSTDVWGTTTATVAIAILLHKTLSAFAVGAALLKENVNWTTMGSVALVFSMMSPLGSIAGYITCGSTGQAGLTWNAIFMLVAAGTFLFISLVEFLPTSFEEGAKGPGSISSRIAKTLLFSMGSVAVVLAELKTKVHKADL